MCPFKVNSSGVKPWLLICDIQQRSHIIVKIIFEVWNSGQSIYVIAYIGIILFIIGSIKCHIRVRGTKSDLLFYLNINSPDQLEGQLCFWNFYWISFEFAFANYIFFILLYDKSFCNRKYNITDIIYICNLQSTTKFRCSLFLTYITTITRIISLHFM